MKNHKLIAEFEDLKDYVFELEEWLKLRMQVLTGDVNKLMKAYLDNMIRMREDHDTIRLYLQQDKNFQKWSSKQILKERQ